MFPRLRRPIRAALVLIAVAIACAAVLAQSAGARRSASDRRAGQRTSERASRRTGRSQSREAQRGRREARRRTRERTRRTRTERARRERTRSKRTRPERKPTERGGSGGLTGGGLEVPRRGEAPVSSQPPEEAFAEFDAEIGEAANEPAEPETPSVGETTEEAAEEATVSEEPASEEPTEEETAAEYGEIPGPKTQRKYAGPLPSDEGETVIDPIDARFLTYVPFGASSFWIQPWRAYFDTWPASRILDAVGVNFAANSSGAAQMAQLLEDSGFKMARKEIAWHQISYADPTTFSRPAHIVAELEIMHAHGLRPLLVLNGNSEAPAPGIKVKLETTAPAPEGASTVQLTPASAAQVIPWKTGFNYLNFGGAPDLLITSVSPTGVATLSRPLRKALPAGLHMGTTLRFAPFEDPVLPGGEPNPVFEETLHGWLDYVGAVCKLAGEVVGPGNFDLEVWNELSFGSQFLNMYRYETPNPEEKRARKKIAKAIRRAILEETVAYVRNPANGISPAVGITDGFTSQSPFASGAIAPVGLTALSKHPYIGSKSYPGSDRDKALPVDALGERDAVKKSFLPLFTPTYQSLMPEYTITGNWTEDLLRDVAPFTTYVYGFPHGRNVGPAGGQPPQKWITEFNLGTSKAVPMEPDGVTPAPGATLAPADHAHFQAKALLRDLVAMVGKGFARDYFFHAAQHTGQLNIVGREFWEALDANPNVFPGDSAGGETLTGFRDMLSRFQGPGPTGAARQLKLLSITQEGNHAQFQGDGTAAHPPLYDRDVLAVFPFQSSPTRFVIPVYVMTRDLLTLYEPEAPETDIERYDLPQESFRITLGNLPVTSEPPTVSAYDPLRDDETPARLVSQEGSTATFEFAATDYPRLLTLQYPS